jgi:hypothetical protein
MADTIRMGFEGKAYQGVAGATASTELTNSRDITYAVDPQYGDTTVRGAGTSPPISTSKVAARTLSIEITMVHDTADTAVVAMLTAAYAGTPVAIRTKDYSSGKGYDGDCSISASQPFPLAGEQVITFTATPTRDEGRDPSAYV